LKRCPWASTAASPTKIRRLPTTSSDDWQLAEYQALSTLDCILFADTENPNVHLYRRGADGLWQSAVAQGALRQASNHLEISSSIDGIVEPRRPDGGQEAGLQEVVDQVLAGRGHKPLDLESGPRCG
jgi:hypothetical protein